MGRKAGVNYNTGVSFVKKETIVNKSTKESMVKEAVKPKVDAEEEKRKEKFKAQMNQAPVKFGKGGSKKEADETKEQNKYNQKYGGLYSKYGKGYKMMRMMGYTPDQHREIVHAVKREDNLGLGVKKEKHIHSKEQPPHYEETKGEFKSGKDKKKKGVSFAEPAKPTDKDFLNFLMKTSKETSSIRKERKTNSENQEFSTKNLIQKQRMFKDMKIIDETGGQAETLFLSQHQKESGYQGNPLLTYSLPSVAHQ